MDSKCETEIEMKVNLAVAVLKQVATCPHCSNCKSLAQQYLEHLGDINTNVQVSVNVQTGKKAL